MNTIEEPKAEPQEELLTFAWRVAFVWLWFMTHCIWRVTVEGMENLPKEGPIILAANHASWIDPPLIAFYFYPRPVHYWTKIELFSVPVLGKLLPHMYTIPIKRGTADRGAIKTAMKRLARGEIFGVFPEGSRHSNVAQKGAALVSLLSKKSLSPVGIRKEGFRVWIRFGPAIPPEGTVEELTARLESAIHALV